MEVWNHSCEKEHANKQLRSTNNMVKHAQTNNTVKRRSFHKLKTPQFSYSKLTIQTNINTSNAIELLQLMMVNSLSFSSSWWMEAKNSHNPLYSAVQNP